MTLQPFSNEELNFLKFASIVLDEFPKALRQIFTDMWDMRIGPLPGYQPWDDSTTVRNLLLKSEGVKTEIPTNVTIQNWDCTALFQATLYAQTFALPDGKGHKRTLSDLYLKKHKPVPGPFHSPIVSPTGDPNETIALVTDQLQLLRNTLCNSFNSRIAKNIFDTYLHYAKEAFTVVNVNTSCLEVIGNMAESDFPATRVQQLNESIKKERDIFYQFLKSGVKDKLDGLTSATAWVKAATGRIEMSVDVLGEKIGELMQKQETVKG